MEIVTSPAPAENRATLAPYASAPAIDARASMASRTLSAVVLGLATLAAALPALLFTPLNHDVACALYYARRMMAGDRIYRDFVENNPPLAFYLGVPVEWLSQRLGLLETQALAWTLIALTIGIVWLTMRIVRLDRHQTAIVRWSLPLACIAAALLLPERDFGQREHFTLLLLIPYACLCAVRAQGVTRVSRVTTLLVAAAATIGFGVKPHFGAVLVALIAYVAIKRRDWRAALTLENIAIASGLAVYAVLILLWTPEYVTEMVPIAARHYGAYTGSVWFLVADTTVRLFVVSLLLLVCVPAFATGSRDAARVIQPLALTGLVFFGVYLVQRTPFRYHLLPSLAFYTLAIAVAVAAFARTLAARRSNDERGPRASRAMLPLALRTVTIVVCALPAVVIGVGMFDSHRADFENARAGLTSPLAGPLVDVVHRTAAGQPIFVLSSSVNPAFPLVNLSGTTWPYRYNCLWRLPTYYRNDEDFGVAKYHAPAAQPEGERAFFDAIVGDLQKTPPAVLIVDRSRFKQAFGAVEFDFVDYYSQSSAFAGLFREYRLIARIRPYDVYKRVPADARATN